MRRNETLLIVVQDVLLRSTGGYSDACIFLHLSSDGQCSFKYWFASLSCQVLAQFDCLQTEPTIFGQIFVCHRPCDMSAFLLGDKQ